MSILGRSVEEEAPKTRSWKCFALPAYVIISALFIAYSLYSYLVWVVYQSGQQQGYTVAVQDLATQVSEKCEPVAITIGQEQVDVINVACLQEAADATALPETPSE